jgi:hypothetical protein
LLQTSSARIQLVAFLSAVSNIHVAARIIIIIIIVVDIIIIIIIICKRHAIA